MSDTNHRYHLISKCVLYTLAILWITIVHCPTKPGKMGMCSACMSLSDESLNVATELHDVMRWRYAFEYTSTTYVLHGVNFWNGRKLFIASCLYRRWTDWEWLFYTPNVSGLLQSNSDLVSSHQHHLLLVLLLSMMNFQTWIQKIISLLNVMLINQSITEVVHQDHKM